MFFEPAQGISHHLKCKHPITNEKEKRDPSCICKRKIINMEGNKNEEKGSIKERDNGKEQGNNTAV